jgi:uncharacterized protein YneF (UPF0154 family)
MSEETVTRLASQSRIVGYYAGLIFGVGYCLTLIGVIAVFVEIMARSSEALRYVTAQIPAWFIAALIFLFIGVVCGIYFSLTIIRNSKTVRESGLNINAVSSSVNAFSFMLLFVGIGFTILAAGLKASLFTPICGVVGAILLFVGFRVYRSEAPESKLIGAIILLVSIVLTYFVAYKDINAYIGAGPLFSEPTVEVISLLIAVICGIIFAFPILKEELKQTMVGVILSVSAILFSCGVMYFNFSAVSAIDRLRYLGGLIYGTPSIPRWPGYATVTLDSVWILFFGFLLLGISGILILVAACLPLAISAKQLSTQTKILKPEQVSAPPSPEIKYCPKCGASVPADAVFCPKCGYRQSKT